MMIKRINLALQGGGAHGAYTWGVLDRLLEEDRLEVEAISGTSAGAMNAAVFADGMGRGGRAEAKRALETAEDGITCNAICPGYVRTPLVEKQIDDQAKAHGIPREQVINDVLLKNQPNKQFIEVAELAALALFLCTDNGASITGVALPMDGGWTAH